MLIISYAVMISSSHVVINTDTMHDSLAMHSRSVVLVPERHHAIAHRIATSSINAMTENQKRRVAMLQKTLS